MPKDKKESKPQPIKANIFIACPNNTGMRNEYSVQSMFAMGWTLGAYGIGAASFTYDSHPISLARNIAVEEFLKSEKFTHLFFIDGDTVPKADVIVRLLQCNKPIVSGWYLSRGGSGLPVVLKITGDKLPDSMFGIVKNDIDFPQWRAYGLKELLTAEKEKDTGLIKVDGVGAGCLLIRREALPHLEKPYFFEDPFKEKSFGEDLFFGLNCKIHGVPIYVDLNSFCAHFASGLIHLGHVKALIEREKQQEKINQTFSQKPPM
jgi:hypothetical protein